MAERRFPAPWSVIEHPDSFEIKDASGQPLAHVYCEDESGLRPNVYFENESGRHHVMKRLTRDEARRIAANIAKLPDLMR